MRLEKDLIIKTIDLIKDIIKLKEENKKLKDGIKEIMDTKEMTTDELLNRLPSHIGRNKILDENGNVIGYMSDDKNGGDIGWLYLHNDGKDWLASYGMEGEFVCLNPDDENPPYNNAFSYGETPQKALQGLYEWCMENGFIDK